MRRLVLVLVAAVAAGIVSFTWLREYRVSQLASFEGRDGADVAWLRSEFNLTDEQFSAVQKLHEDYQPECARHCAAIIAARENLAAEKRIGAGDDDIAAARLAVAELEAYCDAATREHLQRVAAVMEPAEARRFLRMVEPHLARQPHDGNRGPVR